SGLDLGLLGVLLCYFWAVLFTSDLRIRGQIFYELRNPHASNPYSPLVLGRLPLLVLRFLMN
ncbi:hypothetical protein QQP08_000816, partial [Theobroma cacao]